MSKRRILIQLDSDPQPSVFDAVVAVDSDVDALLRHGGVTPENVRDLVYGAIFTRGPDDLKSTAIFIGGSDVAAGEALLEKVTGTFFGPMRVSVLMDSNGANTTAAAAVLAALRHAPTPQETTSLVLGGTGPVGQRAARLLAREGARVRVGSRSLQRAQAVCDRLSQQVDAGQFTAHATDGPEQTAAALEGAQVVMSAGAPGIQLLSAETRRSCSSLEVAVDLNAVPPLGIEGLEVHDKDEVREGVHCYGAIGVGGTKMKIHKAALARLFESNDAVLDAEEVYNLGKRL